MFYDYAEYIGYGFTLGSTTYAPDGKWSKAGTVRAGDYSRMHFACSFREKDWSQQLTPEEVEVWHAFEEVLDAAWEETDPWDVGASPDEDEVSARIAAQFDMSADKFNNIVRKQIIWMIMDEEE